jgi:bifunctional non-homologous end joining protein LigD
VAMPLDSAETEFTHTAFNPMAYRSPIEELSDSVRTRLRREACPIWVSPMLATLTEERFSRKGWLFEPKFDGERCLALRCGSDVQLLSRNRKRQNDSYPELVTAFRNRGLDLRLRPIACRWLRHAATLHSRKELLRNALNFEGPVRFTEHRETEGEAYYREACRNRWEGIIAKNGDSIYVSKRSRDWR